MLEKFSMAETIIGDNIILVKRDHDYDAEMHETIENNRRFLRKFLFWVDKEHTLKDAIAATDRFLDGWEKGEKFAYIIADKHSEKLLGCIDIHSISLSNHTAEIGYWLRKDKTGFGYMTEAVKLIEKEAFSHGIRRLEICCDAHNKASCAVAVRCGYEHEATLKEALSCYSEFHDKEIYVKFNR